MKKMSAGVSTAMLLIALAGGCSTNGDAESLPTDRGVARETTDPPAEYVGDDRAICTGFSDVMTIVENADLGVRDGRMELQEQQGWYRLATRVLDRLPSGGDGEVSQAISVLQEIVPAVTPGAGEEVVGIGTAQWHDATEALGAACRDAGVELTIAVFTGG